MEEQELYERAGRVAAEVMAAGLEKIEAGVKLLDVANYVEGEIGAKGAKPAFPCNISVNDVAAHYSPQAWDESTFKAGDLVKLDIGVHIDGYIADIARSKVVGGGRSDLIEAAEKALEEAIKAVKPGAKTNEIGRVIEETIKGAGFLPISNLTGHKLTQYNLHGGVLIPNIWTRHGEEIREGEVYAIEPFATSGSGRVVDEANAIIFRYLQDRPLRMKEARDILEHVKANFGTLPFAERWISDLMPRYKLNAALRQLVYTQALYAYHILREKERGMVAQAEHTVIVTKEGCKITTVL
ncbi:MAG: type II methionyl aminopeptidase [Candidatus Hydrothermarchaeota archaeon]